MPDIEEAWLVTQLNHVAKRNGNGLDTYWATSNAGPRLPIPVILLGSLAGISPDLHELAFEITRGAKVVDKAEPPSKLNSSNPGAMRSWHQNDKCMLPPQSVSEDTSGLSGKALSYHQYVISTKGLMNKQKQKGIKQEYTGYVEFTATGWRGAHVHGRLIFDYQGNKLFLTPSHYQLFKIDGQNLVKTDPDDDAAQQSGNDFQSPFYYIE